MGRYKIALLGFGNVGRAFLRLLQRKKDQLIEDHQLEFTITGIATARHGMAVNQQGLDGEGALSIITSGGSLDTLSTLPLKSDPFEFIRSCGADVLFENTPVNYATGQPAVSLLRLALQCGMHAITANKGPVVHAYQELTDLAGKQGRKFYFESAVMDGAPIFSLFRQALPSAYLHGFNGILNSTTNLILTRMEDGDSFEATVAYAQSIGIAETDPSGDLDGWDAAVKVAALVTVLMGIPLKPAQVERHGIRDLTQEDILEAKRDGKRWKLVCSARRTGGAVAARVAPEMVAADSPLYGVNGTSSIVTFETDVLPQISIVEGNPGPETTAYGLLADFINATR
ncbi:MAG: homoserine dehydrogenase [Chloroflexi bacterium RBG_16_54_11]|nr:MAG: homoserine dehydrogenase [Chloroflexi bacterium RBG_16_54_11]